jgi:hypothetical protein
MDPMLTKEEKPTLACKDQSRMDVHMAPDWETNATFPGLARLFANVAFRPVMGFY